MTPGDSELPRNWAGASPAWQKAPGLQPRPPASLPRPPCSVPRGQAPVLATAHSCGLLRPLQEWGSVSRVPDKLMGFCPQALPGPGTLWGWFWQILCSGIGPWPLRSCPAPTGGRAGGGLVLGLCPHRQGPSCLLTPAGLSDAGRGGKPSRECSCHLGPPQPSACFQARVGPLAGARPRGESGRQALPLVVAGPPHSLAPASPDSCSGPASSRARPRAPLLRGVLSLLPSTSHPSSQLPAFEVP